MISLPGYNITTQIYESVNAAIYRGVYDKDETPVVIKLLSGEFPSPEQLARFRREYELIRKHTGEKIIQVHALEKYRNTLAIILEDFGGEAIAIHLSDKIKELSLQAKLSLAIHMTEALAQVHSNHIIHKDINLSNFVWNPETDRLKVIDFGISTELSRETEGIKNPDILEGTLSYISPEQTGRMNKSLDYRTDYYSLGVSFYHLFTGRLPFYSDDTMEMVHSHIAKTPLSPNKLHPEIPEAVSDIVMKLLSKSPEDRYQSSAGLKKDLLHCHERLSSNLKIKSTLCKVVSYRGVSGPGQIWKNALMMLGPPNFGQGHF